jgi:hypothetical protein
MSYCRFSSENSKSDVYCYQHIDGHYVIHVAEYVFNNEIRNKSFEDIQESDMKPIGLKYDGACFTENTPSKTADRLEMLRAEGYYVPQRAIDILRKE